MANAYGIAVLVWDCEGDPGSTTEKENDCELGGPELGGELWAI
jgi:hypothetical protein